MSFPREKRKKRCHTSPEVTVRVNVRGKASEKRKTLHTQTRTWDDADETRVQMMCVKVVGTRFSCK